MSDFEKPGLIQRNVYEMEKKLQGETMKAVTKSQYKEPMQEPLVIIKKPLKIEFKGTPEFIGKLAMRDFEIERKLMNDTNEALGITSEYFTPTEILTSVTPEMIEDQKIEETLNKPSGFSIELEKPTLIEFRKIFTNEELEKIKIRGEAAYKKNVNDLTKKIDENNEELNKYKADYNKKIAEFNRLLSMSKTPGTKPVVEKQRANLVKEYNDKIRFFDKVYQDIIFLLDKEDLQYNAFIEEVKEYKENVEGNKAEQLRVNRINKGLLENYAYDLSLLYPGLGILEQKGDETNEEFKKRLDSVAVPISAEERKQREGRLSFEQAKRNLKQFFTDPSRVEFLVKQIENRNEFNKMFIKIKTDYLARYGVDNKQIRNEEVIDYITEAIKQPNFLSQEPVREQPIEPVMINRSEYYGERTYSKSTLFDIADANNVPRTGTKQQLYERLLRSGHLPKKGGVPRMPRVPTGTPYIFPTIPEETPGEMVGVGVKNYPKTVKFGKVTISLDDLYYKNMLKIRLPNKRSIIGFPNKRISDIFVSIIMKLIEGNPITKTDLDFLKPAEKTMYNKLLVVSGLHKTVSNTYEETIEEMKQRLRLIEGQLKAGNDNTSILKEAHSILHGMSACGLISGNAASRYYKELKASQME